MTKAMLLAWSSPVDEQAETEFANWYDGTHVPQVRAAVPGIARVRRFRLLDGDGSTPARYLCCYEIDEGDAAQAAAALGAAAANGAFDMSPAMDVTHAPPVLQFLDALD